MKKLFILVIAGCLGLMTMAQQRANMPEELKDLAVKRTVHFNEANPQQNFIPQVLNSYLTPVETEISASYYDRQTNATIQNRLHYFEDGTFGATWMHGYNQPNFDDRGTGYVYFDGMQWSEPPTGRIESQRCGWPNYWPLGENGELVISHLAGAADEGLLINRRTEKGSGDWVEYIYEAPEGADGLSFPCCVTTGIDHNTIHLLSMTKMVQFGGSLYQGIDGAMVYSRSSDGGETWEIDNEILPQMTSDDFAQFRPDQFAFAPPRGNLLAFVVGGTFNEAFLMKSSDEGDTWEKTLIWEHPYPGWNNEPTDTFYCPDGCWDIKLDNSGMAHCVFGVNRALSDGAGTSWFPFIDGVGYWNETMPAFSGTFEALNPYGEPGSELIEDYNLIGWSQDIDGDGEITLIGTGIDAIGSYYVGFSSMPQLVMGESNQLYVIWSSVTETYDNGLQNFRHLWSRVSTDGGTTWGPFTDLTQDIAHLYDECVWPDAAIRSDPNTLYLMYQKDGDPGMAVGSGEDPFHENDWVFMEVNKDEITGIEEKYDNVPSFTVHPNYPNPFSDVTNIRVELTEDQTIGLELINLTGQTVYRIPGQYKTAGSYVFTLSAEGLSKGVYFYTVTAREEKVSRKLIVE